MTRNQIQEVKRKLDGRVQRFNCQLVDWSANRAVVIYYLERAYQINELCLPAGTLSYGHFWQDRNYNVYHWVSPEGDSIGLYLNICDSTSITSHEIEWRDLEVDILLRSDGRATVLDEDELPPDISAETRKLIQHTYRHILKHAAAIITDVEVATAALLSCHTPAQ